MHMGEFATSLDDVIMILTSTAKSRTTERQKVFYLIYYLRNIVTKSRSSMGKAQ